MDWNNFKGFQSPNTTQIPDDFFDHVMPHLSEAELKVLLYILRRTLGFKKERDAISYSQFLEGIKKRDGTQLDEGAGIKPTALKSALKSLEEKHLIFRVKQVAEDGGKDTTIYELNLGQHNQSESDTPMVEKRPTLGQNLTQPHSRNLYHTTNSLNNIQRRASRPNKNKEAGALDWARRNGYLSGE